MRKVFGFVFLAAVMATGFALIGCSKSPTGDGGKTPKTEDGLAAANTPKPPFAGPAPANAMVVDDIDIGRYGGKMVIALPGNPKSFNPILANETSTTEILYGPVFQSCVGFDNVKQEETPGICDRWDRSEDGLTYTFHVREGINWSDGKPITADDFEFNYNLILDEKIPSSVKDLFKQGVDETGKPIFPKFEKIDGQNFRFTLAQPDVLFTAAVGSIYIVPKHKFEETYNKGDFNKALTLQTPPKDIVTSGPFVIADFKTEERVLLARNPHYWKVDKSGNRLPYLDGVVFLIVPDYNAQLLQFRQGGSDVLDVRPEDYELLKRKEADGDYNVTDLGPSFNTNYLMFNLDDGQDADGKPFVDPIREKWFANKNFRKAVSHAIDRDGIVRTVLSGRGEPLWSFYSPANKKWYNDQVVQYKYDLTKAAEYLKGEGFQNRDGTLFDAEGHKVEFTIITNSENSTRIAMLNVIKDDLKKLGMEVNIRPVPFNDVVTSLRDARNFEAVLLGWGSAVPPDPAQSKNVMLSSGRSHSWHPEQKTPATPWEARMDELLHKCVAVYDYAERKKYSDELLYIFSDEQPQIQLVVASAAAAARRNVGNFNPSGLRPKTHWNIEVLYLKNPKAGN
ncbi:MAG: ABC transporter substrate-binding protein [Myxococcales bacterium]|nr:ABC transporter substrate-binding protein [Myxococcales bacterium]